MVDSDGDGVIALSRSRRRRLRRDSHRARLPEHPLSLASFSARALRMRTVPWNSWRSRPNRARAMDGHGHGHGHGMDAWARHGHGHGHGHDKHDGHDKHHDKHDKHGGKGHGKSTDKSPASRAPRMPPERSAHGGFAATRVSGLRRIELAGAAAGIRLRGDRHGQPRIQSVPRLQRERPQRGRRSARPTAPSASELDAQFAIPAATADEMGRMTYQDTIVKTVVSFAILVVGCSCRLGLPDSRHSRCDRRAGARPHPHLPQEAVRPADPRLLCS